MVIPSGSWLHAVVRGAGVPAYLSSFTAIMATAFAKKVKKATGKPFLSVHHIFAVAAFAFMIIHASAFSVYMKDPGVFIPEPGTLLFKKPVEPPFGHAFDQYPAFHYYEVV